MKLCRKKDKYNSNCLRKSCSLKKRNKKNRNDKNYKLSKKPREKK